MSPSLTPRRPARRRTGVVLISLAVVLGLGGPADAARPDGEAARDRAEAAPRGPVVLRVIDGDTIEVRGDGAIIPAGARAKVRLLEIDAPEKGDCFSREATRRTATLLPVGTRLRVERDEALKDRYQRYLLYVWNERGVLVNESLVRTGHAEAVLYPPNDKYWPTISRAQTAAVQAGAGLWKACAGAPAAPPAAPGT
ncbi:thermonuclease family protein [Streptomyces lavendofoliae]|uniref:thermonuclease family protein n=1 Tax=Streptomyces lavendofoliae TaxID=67314 RepID=UPI00300ED1D8